MMMNDLNIFPVEFFGTRKYVSNTATDFQERKGDEWQHGIVVIVIVIVAVVVVAARGCTHRRTLMRELVVAIRHTECQQLSTVLSACKHTTTSQHVDQTTTTASDWLKSMFLLL